MSIRLITRADDFGSCHAADQAILAALEAGVLIRNVSCMAVGSTIQESAEALSIFADQVDIGLHFVLNSEWDSVKWTCDLFAAKKLRKRKQGSGTETYNY